MKVLLIEPSGAGGLGHYIQGLISGLTSVGCECILLTSDRFPKNSVPETVVVHRVFRGKRTNPLRLWWTLFRLRGSYDRVHWHSATHPNHLLTLMRYFPLARVPFLQTVHNVLPHENPEEHRTVYASLYQRMQGLIFHSHFSQMEFEKHFPDIRAAKAIIPMGEFSHVCRDEPIGPVPGSENTILFFGNIRPYKGLDLLLQAIPAVLKQHPTARLIIAGQPIQPWQPFSDIINLLRIGDAVHTRLQYIPDEEIPRLFASASIVAMPYRAIDQSGVLLLAMAEGKAIVTTCVGGLPEVIRHEHTGILIPPDDVDSLVQGLVSLLQNPDRARQMGETARQECVERFNWETIARQTLEFYRTVSE